MKKKNNEIDKIINEYFNIFEEDLGFSAFYDEESEEEVRERIKRNFKYFKAGFLFANIDTK